MTVHLLHVKNLSILEQLRLEEALLRTDQRNFFLINEGSSAAVVMGISGRCEELVDRDKADQQKIPIIKRFSGGGTVIVDEHTLFTTFIGQKELIHPFACYPEPILRWSSEFYHTAFSIPQFGLRENDFVVYRNNLKSRNFGKEAPQNFDPERATIAERQGASEDRNSEVKPTQPKTDSSSCFGIDARKCGGNAQYIQRDRWLLHTSFLWDFCPDNMQILLHPKKTPLYRKGRPHTEFICRLADFFSSKATLIAQIKQALIMRFHVIETSLKDLQPALAKDHRRSTTTIS